jgi:hypothetical protein
VASSRPFHCPIISLCTCAWFTGVVEGATSASGLGVDFFALGFGVTPTSGLGVDFFFVEAGLGALAGVGAAGDTAAAGATEGATTGGLTGVGLGAWATGTETPTVGLGAVPLDRGVTWKGCLSPGLKKVFFMP